MAKGSMLDNMAKQQQKWEKKKEKMEKREKTERGSQRKSEKEAKKVQKEELCREQKDVLLTRGTDSRVVFARVAVAALYVTAMALLLRSASSGDVEAETTAGLHWAALPGVLTALTIVSVTAVEHWRQHLERVEMQQEAANAIKDSLEKKQTEKEREEVTRQRRLQQQKEAQERRQRRTEEEAAALNQARDLARAMRRRREEREAEEARERREAELIDDGERDEQGWTARQRQKLRDAVLQYPEGWSHSRKKRWEMIASEVKGQNARTCEEMFALLEAERLAASARITKPEAQAQVAPGLQDDLDWMGGDTEGEAAWFAGDADEDEEDDEEDEEDETVRERMLLELEPDHKGTQIRLDNIKEMKGCATVQLEVLHLQLACAECRTATRLFLSGADEEAADVKTWCEGCSGLISARLRPTMLHRSNTRLCYVDCVRCTVTDVLPSVLMSFCENCNAENVHKQEFVRNRIIDGTCFGCHSKYAFGAQSISIDQITPCEMGGHSGVAKSSRSSKDAIDDPMDEIAEELRYLRKKAKTDPRQQLIKLGSALPQMGACRHFKKSYKWFRFACCGRAFPCPECHVESECPAAALGAHANRMICGKCSMEQSYSPARPCEKCGFTMQAKGSSHWDGGIGTRNLATMSSKDAKKFKGGLRQSESKFKTSSKKTDRVGAKAKAKRDQEQKFGKDK
eukprot:TRINITY_DN13446_c1_g2_i2.p1 TRINITY_DN13446_c1_g2~~TRINITY_DN13446_c1_g2_i2.p1  ORF type:complete len:686 (-),score=211.33 TRINITY_DN13446_c1_g2_i2:28-2085(-)